MLYYYCNEVDHIIIKWVCSLPYKVSFSGAIKNTIIIIEHETNRSICPVYSNKILYFTMHEKCKNSYLSIRVFKYLTLTALSES